MNEPEQWAVELWYAASDAATGGSVKWKPKANAAAALAIQAAFAEREARLVGAMKWAGEVSPPVNDFGCVTVELALDELNAMRVLAGFKPLPARKDRSHD